MIIDAISDLHGHYPTLEGGDLLIVAGDLTAGDRFQEIADFYIWLDEQEYKKKIVIAGNHDNYFYACHSRINPPIVPFSLKNTDYLCDCGTEFEGLKIWGSPWTKTFEGMNPHCKAFTMDDEEELAKKWALIPDDIDILITHSPPFAILDKIADGKHVGSHSLRSIMFKIKPKLMVYGHIHECGGKMVDLTMTICVNASHVNEHYKPVNKPIRVIL